jgi:SnoaL-like domain
VRAEIDDLLEIHNVLALWGHVLDNRDWDRLSDCLTEDAEYDSPFFGFHGSGYANVLALLRDGKHTAVAHHCTNVLIEPGAGPDERNVRSKGIGVREDGTISSVTYVDKFRRTPAGWRITKRALVQP